MNEDKNLGSEYKIIYAHIVGSSFYGLRHNEKSKLQIINCCNSDNCALHKRDECCIIDGWINNPCPYGTHSNYAGYSRRSLKHYKWIKEQTEKYISVLDKLSLASNVMAVVGEFIYLPYAHITINKTVPFKNRNNFFSVGDSMLEMKYFTIDNIISICEFKPYTIFGDSLIVSYQKNEIPKFVKHLSEQFPDLYNELCEKLPRIKDIPLTNVGRKAYLFTLNSNIGQYVDCHNSHWIWDGQYLISHDSKASFILVDEFDEIKLKPTGNPIVDITEDAQTNKNTIYYKS